jgi:N-acetylglucosamine kinase
LSGEIGHLALPYYEASDGELVPCGCGQTGCIEKLIAGAALARLYHAMTGKDADARHIAELARRGEADALGVLDHYYTIVAKALVTVLHSFDPEIITVSGGLNALPGLYSEVPKRWGKYAVTRNPVTKFVPAMFGAMAGLRGAAWLGRAA